MIVIQESVEEESGYIVGIGGLYTPRLVHDGMKGVRGRQGKMTVEEVEDYITLILQTWETEINVEKPDRSGRDHECVGDGGVELFIMNRESEI